MLQDVNGRKRADRDRALKGGVLRGIPVGLRTRIETFIEKAPIPLEDRVRFQQFTVLVLLGVPTMVAYGLFNLVKGYHVLAAVIFVSAFGLSVGLYALGRMERGISVYRINAVVYCVLLIYMLVIGGVGGSKILWMYTFPLIAVFLVGKREGIVWAGAMLFLGGALMIGAVPGVSVFPYPRDFQIRFVSTYAIVAAMAFWFEHFRETYRAGMEAKWRELEQEKAKSQESEKGLKKAQQFANVGSWTWQIQSNRFEGSDQLWRIFGIDEDGLTGDLGEVITRSIHPDDRAAVEQTAMSVVREKKTTSLEFRVLRSDRTERTVWTEVGEPILDDAGQPAVLRGTVQDITERRRVERKQVLMAAMLDATPGFVGFADAEDNRVLYVNPAGREMVGIRPQEDVTRFKVFDFHPEWTNTLLRDECIPTAGRDGVWVGENAFLDRDGREIPVLMVLLAHKSPKGEVEQISTVSIDMTARKRAEEEKQNLQSQLQQAMKMEAVGRLAGGIAHDFNNILTAITGNLSLALMDLSPSDPSTRMLIEAKTASERAARLTQQLLAFSRRQIIDPKTLDLNDVIAGLKSMLSRLIGENIVLRTVPGLGLGPVKADPGQIEQILANLVVNARDATPDGGTLSIETANADLDEDYCARHPDASPGRFVMLAVTDTGHGMSEEVSKQAFEPFFTTKPQGSGTGLGLSTIYGAVRQSEGFIEVHSEEGKGTTFRIFLPRAQEELEDSKTRSDEGPAVLAQGTETVLVVEDEEIVRNLCIRFLKRLGYTVLHASDGEDALAKAKEYGGRVDLLMTDVVMPGMNGRELADQLVAIHPETKVLLTSGYTESTIVHQGVLDEGLAFIGKPYSISDLAGKVREVLDQVGSVG